MIFSKDKKPTQDGWYWMLLEGVPVVVEAVFIGGVGRTASTAFENTRSIRHSQDSFGDRIETPTVEAPAITDKGGEAKP